MQDIGARIMEVIVRKGITKSEFANRLNLSQAYVSQMTTQGKIPSDRTILDICQKFSVNETWLRTGEGEMMIPVDREKEISAFMGDIMKGEPDFRRALVHVLARMTPDEWAALEAKARELMETMETPPSE